MKINWCSFGFHKWTKWEDKGIIEVFENTTTDAVEQLPSKSLVVQERRCEVCNKLNMKREKR